MLVLGPKQVSTRTRECVTMPYREDQFTVNAFDCRPDGHIKPNVLMQYLQEGAARHAEQLGVGLEALQRRGCFWVLANVRLEIGAAPQWGDEMTIRTWPSGCTRVAATREFVGTDAAGRELFRASSEWMILDKRTGRLKNLARLALDLPPDGPKVLPTPLHRLEPAAHPVRADVLRVPFSALDFNGHVNNTEYIRWACDGLHRHLGRLPPIRTLQATYLAEAFEGDEIEIWVAAAQERPLGVLARRSGVPTIVNVFLMEISA
jgi:medium-chain acyl-[acyl-carrier-protein] hydrolase